MKPYKNLNSENLGLLLLLARATAIIGVLFIALAIITSLIGIVVSGSVMMLQLLALIPMSISVLFLSGLMAAIVAFEENYRVRTMHLLNNKNNL